VPRCVPGSGRVLGAGDLEHVLARLLRRHAELLLGNPGLDSFHGRARSEAVVYGLAVEGDGHRHMAAAVQVGLDGGLAGAVAYQAALIHRLVAVLEIDQGLLVEAVLLDDRDLDGGEGSDPGWLRNARSRGFPRPGRRRRLRSCEALLAGIRSAAPLPFSVPSKGDRKNQQGPERP
jgi:hypothetical protein